MKILFTGMASSHTNPEVHKSNLGFFGVLADVLSDTLGHEIEWKAPSVSWTEEDLEKYDQIFLGLIPPTSLGANKVYGALNVLNLVMKNPKAVLVLDHPQLWQFKTSFASIARDPSTLVSRFYAKRSEYSSVKDNQYILDIFASVSQRMAEGKWPKTIYPSLPWKDKEEISRILGIHNPETLVPVNLDSHLLNESVVSQIGRHPIWLMDNISTIWSKTVANMVHMDIDLMKSSKKESDSEIYEKIRMSLGSMITPQDRGVGTWWSYRYIQSLNAETPIVTDWRECIELSDSWGFLAYQVEEMSEIRRRELSRHQKDSYLKAIPSKIESINQISSLLKSEGEVSNA